MIAVIKVFFFYRTCLKYKEKMMLRTKVKTFINISRLPFKHVDSDTIQLSNGYF